MLLGIDTPSRFRNLQFTLGQSAAARATDLAQRNEQAMVLGLFRALSVFRIATLIWATLGVALSREHLIREPLAWAMVGLMVATTAMLTPKRDGIALLKPTATTSVIFEVAVGLTVLLADGVVYTSDRTQSLPWSWPAAGVMAAGILFGARAGLLTALGTGAAAFASEVVMLDRGNGVVGAISKLGLWVLTGTIAGYVVARLRRAEAEISVVRAREEVARELHDGVLQTLAVIQRRSTDSELAALARDQEHDLRGFLAASAGTIDEGYVEFEPAMHQLAAMHERRYPGCKVNIVVAGELPELSNEKISALSGAVGEALTNASKHGAATKATIFAEPAEDSFTDRPASVPSAEVFVSVKDNGTGFDPDSVIESIGLSQSIRGRIEEAGGSADVESAAGRGAEVQLWI